jgi:hypothetical protein
MPSASTITVVETLGLLDDSFASFAEGVADDRYALWLGSGISLGRIDGLWQVIPELIEFLRMQISPGDANCKYRKAFDQVMNLANQKPADVAGVIAKPFAEWSSAEAITGSLINNYARLLQITVVGEPDDYLLWDGIGMVKTFADPTRMPDVEHLCIAILILEGVSSDIASANWDGLIEKAVSILTNGSLSLVVCVHPEELREPARKARLFKFHGCAVKAAENEARYREYLIGRQPQINRWTVDHRPMAERLVTIITSKPTLMIGLSAQDANIQAIFAKAQDTMEWIWPGDRPSVVFSTNAIGMDQTGLLENVYREAYTPDKREDVNASASFPAYAKPLLLGLVLHVICSKLRKLSVLAESNFFGAADRERLQAGVLTLRDAIAGGTGETPAERLTFINTFIAHAGRAVSMFRSGQKPTTPLYLPVTGNAVHQFADDATIAPSGIAEAAVAIAIIGILVGEKKVTVSPASLTDAVSGSFSIVKGKITTKVFFAANSNAALRLRVNGHIEDARDSLLIHSLEIIEPMKRYPRKAPGRTRRAGLREVSITTLLAGAKNTDDLVQRFREEVGQ